MRLEEKVIGVGDWGTILHGVVREAPSKEGTAE